VALFCDRKQSGLPCEDINVGAVFSIILSCTSMCQVYHV